VSGPRAPELGVVVVSFNTRELLRACLGSVAAELAREGLRPAPGGGEPAGEGADGRPTAIVRVVDNASEDGSAAMVASDFPWVRLDALAENAGFTRGNNRALAGWARDPDACPRFVLLLNPDAELTAGCLGRLMATLRAHPEAGAVGPQLRYPDGRFQHAAFRFPGLVQTVLDLWPIARLADAPINGRYPRPRYDAGRPFEVDLVLGACLMMTGDALRRVGPLDEGFTMYCEEVDWCRRAAGLGLVTLCEPRAVAIHHGGASSAQRRPEATRHLWRSRLRWFDLHAPTSKARLLRRIVRAGLAARARADDRAVARGALAPAERDALRAAYRGVFEAGTP